MKALKIIILVITLFSFKQVKSQTDSITVSPNPFTYSTTIIYTVTATDTITMMIYSNGGLSTGQLLRTIINDSLVSAGTYTLNCHTQNLPTGTLYFYLKIGVSTYYCKGINMEGTLGFNQITSSNEVTIYPNPAKDVLNVECLMVNETTKITISDILGNAIYHSTLNTQHNTIDISNLQSGLYLVKIQTDEGTSIKKFVKE